MGGNGATDGGAGMGGNGATDGGADGEAASVSSTSSLMMCFLIPLILRFSYLLVLPPPLHSLHVFLGLP